MSRRKRRQPIRRKRDSRQAHYSPSSDDRRIIDLKPDEYKVMEQRTPTDISDKLSKELLSTENEKIFEMSARSHGSVDENYKFKQFRRLTRGLLRAKAKVKRQLFWESPGLVVEVTSDLINKVKRMTGMQVRTLNDVLREEHDKVDEILSVLSSLYGICTQHYEDIREFRKEENLRRDEINIKRPLLMKNSELAFSEYMRIKGQLENMSPGEPGYGSMRETLSRMREAIYERRSEFDCTKKYETLVGDGIKKLDDMATVLQHGRHFFKELGLHYMIAEKYLRRAAPAGAFISRILENLEVMCESVAIANNCIEEACTLERKLDDPRVFAMAYRQLPETPVREGVGGAIDRANQKYLKQGVKYLLE